MPLVNGRWLARPASRCRRDYILPLWFSVSFFLSFFSTPNLWGHWTDLKTKFGHIFSYDCYLKNLVRHPPGVYRAHGLGAKNGFLGPTSNFDGKYLSNETWYRRIDDQKETRQSTETPLHAPELVNFGPQTAENGLASFCPPPKVCAQDELQAHIWDTFRFNHIRQMAPMVDADAKSLVGVVEAVRRAASR